MENRDVERFVILDDMDITGFNGAFLRIDPKTGLHKKYIQKVSVILNKNTPQGDMETSTDFTMSPKHEMPNLCRIEIEGYDFVTSEDVISNFSWVFRDCDVFFIDYFQLLTDNQIFGEREKRLKEIAEEYNMAIVCLSKVDRQLELREDRRPTPKDLECIGVDISQIDKAIFLYRPSYYGKEDFRHPLEKLNKTADEYSEVISYQKRKDELKLRSIAYASFDKINGIWN